MKTKILLILLLIVGPSLKAQGNYISIGADKLCWSDGVESPGVGGAPTSSYYGKYYFEYQFRRLDNGSLFYGPYTIPSSQNPDGYIYYGQLPTGAITLPKKDFNYKVEVKRCDGNTCSDKVSFEVYFPNSTFNSVVQFDETVLCPGINIKGTGNSASNVYSSLNYTWVIKDVQNNEVPNNQNNKDLDIQLPPGIYKIKRIHSGTCFTAGGSNEVNITVIADYVKADFEADVQKIGLGRAVHFTNLSKNAESYEWNFYDGDIIYEEHPWHYYNKGSRSESVFYDVELTAIGQSGCKDKKKIAKMIEVLKYDEKDGNQIIFNNGEK